MNEKKARRLLLLTDDNFTAEVLGTYMRRDNIHVERIESAGEVATAIALGADGVIIDLAKRGLTADSILNVTSRAQRWEIPVLIMSAQSRRALSEFAAVVRATDTISKTEAMTSIAARVRMCVLTPMRPAMKNEAVAPLTFALA